MKCVSKVQNISKQQYVVVYVGNLCTQEDDTKESPQGQGLSGLYRGIQSQHELHNENSPYKTI